jgi:hypothetical protein
MALVVAVALTLVVPPALMKAIMRSEGPDALWGRHEYVDGVTALALTSWTVVLAPLILVWNRSRLRRASRSYGTSAVLGLAQK